MNTDASHDQKALNVETPAPRPQQTGMLIVFRVGELRLGIDVRGVREVVRAVPLSTPMPGARGVAGMITLRGKPAAVVDLGDMIGIPCERRDRRARMIAVPHRDTTVCLLVDQVEGLHDVGDSTLEPPPPVIADLNAAWLDCVTHLASGELVGVINVDRVLSQVAVAKTEVDTVDV